MGTCQQLHEVLDKGFTGGENALRVACQQPNDLDDDVDAALVLEQALTLVSDTLVAPYSWLTTPSPQLDLMKILFEEFGPFTRSNQAQTNSAVYGPQQRKILLYLAI